MTRRILTCSVLVLLISACTLPQDEAVLVEESVMSEPAAETDARLGCDPNDGIGGTGCPPVN